MDNNSSISTAKIYIIPICAYLLAVVLYLLIGFIFNGDIGLPLDDSYIHLVFARSISQWSWFEFNPGEPTSGSTAPLYSLLLGALFKITGPGIIPSIIMGIVLGFGVVYFSIRLLKFLGSDKSTTIAAGIIIAIAYPLVWGALSGMEISLACLLVTSGLYYHFRSVREKRSGSLSMLLFSFAILSRPEISAVALFILFDKYFRLEGKRKRILITNLLILSAFPVLFIVINHYFTGAVLPNTFFAKSKGGTFESLINADYYRVLLNIFLRPLFNLFIMTCKLILYNPFIALTALAVVVKHRQIKDAPHWKEIRLLLLIVIFIPIIIGAFVGTSFLGQYERYVSYVIPAFVMIFSWGAANLRFHRAAPTTFIFPDSIRIKRLVLFGVIIIVSIIFLVVYSRVMNFTVAQNPPHLHIFKLTLISIKNISIGVLAIFPVLIGIYSLSKPHVQIRIYYSAAVIYTVVIMIVFAGVYADNVDNINKMQVNIARWAEKNIPLDANVALNDVGAFGYYAPQDVFDIQGLISPEVIPYNHGGYLYEYLLMINPPDYLIFFRGQDPKLENDPRLSEVYSVVLSKNTICAGDEMVVYKIVKDFDSN